MNIKQFALKYAPIATTLTWAALGFHRGWTDPSHPHQKFYVDKLVHGLAGTFIYMFPLTMPVGIYFELYDLEKKIRGLDDFGNKRRNQRNG